MNSAGAGAVAVRVRNKRQCAGVDNNHTKMLSAVTAYIRGQVDKRRIRCNISLKGIGTLTQMRRVTITDILFWVWNSSRYHILQFAMIFILVLHT